MMAMTSGRRSLASLRSEEHAVLYSDLDDSAHNLAFGLQPGLCDPNLSGAMDIGDEHLLPSFKARRKAGSLPKPA
jgi:hypothetical protein